MNIPYNNRNNRNTTIFETSIVTGVIQKTANCSIFRSARTKVYFFCCVFLFCAAVSLFAQSNREYVFENGKLLAVKENDNPCSLSSTTAVINGNGGWFSFNVMCPSGYAWTAASYVSWATIAGGSSGTGNGQVTYSVSGHSGNQPRTGMITAAAQSFIISQNNTIPCQQICANEKQTCESTTVMCPDYCYVQVFSVPACQMHPSTCAGMYNNCIPGCASMIQSACNSQYNQCVASCK